MKSLFTGCLLIFVYFSHQPHEASNDDGVPQDPMPQEKPSGAVGEGPSKKMKLG